MNLTELAESDLAFILEDHENGFGVPIEITSPAGVSYLVYGHTIDIGQPMMGINSDNFIQTGLGVGVSGRMVEVTLRISTLLSTIGSIPNKSESGTGWLFKFGNVNAEEWTFAIDQPDIDRKMGIVKYIMGLVKQDSGS